MKIIFILDNFINNKTFERLEINYLLTKHYDVEIYILKFLINKNYIDYKLSINHTYEPKVGIKYLEKKEALTLIKNTDNKETIFFSPIYNINAEDIFNEINKKQIKLCGFDLALLPKSVRNYNFVNILKRNINRNLFFSFKKKIVSYYNKKKFYPLYDLYFICGAKCLTKLTRRSVYIKVPKKIIKASSSDYSKILISTQKNKFNFDFNYTLFLDENPLHHEDLIYHNVEPLVDKNYYNDLIKIFDEYEKKTNLKIIIARHPKNFNTKNLYEREEITKLEEYIQNSQHIIMHCSAAINLAVTFRKKIIFLNSMKYKKSYQDDIHTMAKSINQNSYYHKNNIMLHKEIDNMKLDINAYRSYFTDYISASEDQIHRNGIIWDREIRNIFKN